MIKTAIILAGGFGTRLRAVLNDVPKPMAPVNGHPFLAYQVRYLEKAGISTIVFSTGYLAEQIETYFKTFSSSIHFRYSHEAMPLGTGGGIRKAMTLCDDEQVLVLNGDSFFELPLGAFFEFYTLHSAAHALALREVPDCSRYGTVQVNAAGEILQFGEKTNDEKPGLINAGVYLLNTAKFLAETPSDKPFSIEQDYFQKEAGKGSLFGQPFNSYFIDIGLPDDYQKAQHDFERFIY